MERRKVLIGMGSLAAAGAATLGTGAFTSVEADRSISVQVASDSNAYLALKKISGSPNSDDYVDVTDGTVEFDFTSSAGGGDGFNLNAVTEVDNLLAVENQGTQSAYLSVDLDDLDRSGPGGGEAYVGLEVDEDASSSSGTIGNNNIAENGGNGGAVDDPTTDGAYELAEGTAVALNLIVDTTNYDPGSVGFPQGDDATITFKAQQTDPL